MAKDANINTERMRLPTATRQLRLGIVGGGGGGFIGPVHAMAARLDNRWQLVAGALSSRAEVAAQAGQEWFLPPDRSYADYREMIRQEAARPDGAEVIAITTPNHTHHAIAACALEAGLHVICDKPLTTTLAEAEDLERRVTASGRQFFVTHAFAAYPTLREARAMITQGDLGPLHAVHVEFFGDWLTVAPGERPASGWRTDPAQSGPGGAIADIGTHAFHLAQFATGLEITDIAAQLSAMHPERQVDDTAHMLLRFANGATGTLLISQAAPGGACGLRLRVFGAKGGLEWAQETPEHLFHAQVGGGVRRLSRGDPDLSAAAQMATRVPRGHPEGYIEAFANLYSEVAARILSIKTGAPPAPCLAAGIKEGVAGVAFVDAAIRSQALNSRWVSL